MSSKLEFKYFYGTEADNYTFYRIPKILITDEAFKDLTSDAKILYGLMLDRMSLSAKNGWFDGENRVFIYFSIEDVMEQMNCSKNKAAKSIKELDSETGIGLIERKKQGQGKPSIIYVKNFVPEKGVSESQNVGIKNHKICESRISQQGNLESQEMSPNKNKYINTDSSDTESNLILSMREDGMDVNAYAKLIRKNLEVDLMLERHPYDKELIEGIYEIVVEVVVGQTDTIIINGSRYPSSIVKSRFLKLHSGHLEYVMDSLRSTTSRVRNIKKYLLATLFNAPATMSSYYQAEVNADFPQYAVGKRG